MRKSTFYLLDARFDYPSDPPLQNRSIDLTKKAQKCDQSIVGTLSVIPRAPFSSWRSNTPVCQSSRNSGRISSTPQALPLRVSLTTLETSVPKTREPDPKPSDSASRLEGVPLGLRRSLKYSVHWLRTSVVEVHPHCKECWSSRSPLLRHWMLDQNRLEAHWKLFSMASLKASYARVFASATTQVAFHLSLAKTLQLFLLNCLKDKISVGDLLEVNLACKWLLLEVL